MKLVRSIGMTALAIICAGCSWFHARDQHTSAAEASAQDLMIQYGCPSCHVVPHVAGAVGKVGPSLADLAQRSYLAGTLQNSPENLVYWIQHPQHVHPGTAMPEMGVTPQDAVRIAAFLQTNH